MEIAGWILLVLAVLICGLMIYSFAASLLADDEEWEDSIEAWTEPEPVATLAVTHRVWCHECYRERVPFDAFADRNLCPRCKKDLEAVA